MSDGDMVLELIQERDRRRELLERCAAMLSAAADADRRECPECAGVGGYHFEEPDCLTVLMADLRKELDK